METEYAQIPDKGNEVHLALNPQGTVPADDGDEDEVKLTAPIEYDPRSWKETLLVLRGRPFIDGFYGVKQTGLSALVLVWFIGFALVFISSFIGPDDNDRKCRAWCTSFSLGPQPHAYVGVVLFLLMAFRTNEAYRMYASGLTAWTAVSRELQNFATTMLCSTPRDSITEHHRRRMIAFAIAFPFVLQADLLETRQLDEYLGTILSETDITKLKKASSMPLYIIESLLTMVRTYASPEVSYAASKAMTGSIHGLVGPYTEAERIKSNPVAFAYVAHVRLLLMIYLLSMPLALVESLGWSTIPAFMVISYSLMGLEMMAVEVEDPFGNEESDLRISSFNSEIADTLMGSYRRWQHEAFRDINEAAESTFYSQRISKPRMTSRFRYW